MKKALVLLIYAIFISTLAQSQTIPVGSYVEDIARRNQLLGRSDSSVSFSVRPMNSTTYSNDSLLQRLNASKNLFPKLNPGFNFELKILPFSWLSDINPTKQYGYNNGSLYPNVGYQKRITGGVFVKAGILNIQIKPEYVTAANKQFGTFPIIWFNTNNEKLVNAYYYVANSIDAPERFGSEPLKKFYSGQSKITAIYKNFEAGISTENLWWGPGVKNSIMMSNSAPGFFHWTFNSSKPIQTKIGSFEWQLIGGNLKQSGYAPLDTGKWLYNRNSYLLPKPKVDRYISAFTVNWQPKWINGLFVGISGYNYSDKDSTYRRKSFLSKYIPVFAKSSEADNTVSNGDNKDYAYSIYLRQLLTKYNAEIYFEYARNDRAVNFLDFVAQPEHSAAYTIGAAKVFKLRNDQYLQVKMEATQLERSPTYLVRDAPSWYIHPLSPRDGYTNQGRYIGAGIGPGGNSFMADISFVKGQSSAGINIERRVHNNDLYYNIYKDTQTFDANWVDLSTTLYANVILMKKFLLSAQFARVYSINYQYYITPIAKENQTFFSHIGINLSYTL
jgi:hypothetical protein